eukprot:scaffold1341_cov178-Amphora_coffeaeformis.AAC.31
MTPSSTRILFCIGCLFAQVAAFSTTLPASSVAKTYTAASTSASTSTRPTDSIIQLSSSTTTAAESGVSVDPKEAVKLFGRLAEKYIMLDESGGMCCYSACSDCEYRLPDGGYRMADQSAARPKWIPSYVSRTINGKDHTTKWSSELFGEGVTVVDQDTFCDKLIQLAYAPPLGGPYLAASSATVEDSTTAKVLFDVLADGKEKLTKARMSMRLKQLADGEEGMTWPKFQAALGL